MAYLTKRQRKKKNAANRKYYKKLPPEFHVYKGMVTRCHNPKHQSYVFYGGRGIAVCQEWRGVGGFKRFFSDMGERPNGFSLDRIDSDKNYRKDNCRWIPASENYGTSRGCFGNPERTSKDDVPF